MLHAEEEKALPSWRVTRIKGKAASDLGTFASKDAAGAVKQAIAFWDIPSDQHKRLSAYRIA